jgi:hypothetical protein
MQTSGCDTERKRKKRGKGIEWRIGQGGCKMEWDRQGRERRGRRVLVPGRFFFCFFLIEWDWLVGVQSPSTLF